MQMYVNYFDRQVRTQGENRTVGIVLCTKKNQALVTIIPAQRLAHPRAANTNSTCPARKYCKRSWSNGPERRGMRRAAEMQVMR